MSFIEQAREQSQDDSDFRDAYTKERVRRGIQRARAKNGRFWFKTPEAPHIFSMSTKCHAPTDKSVNGCEMLFVRCSELPAVVGDRTGSDLRRWYNSPDRCARLYDCIADSPGFVGIVTALSEEYDVPEDETMACLQDEIRYSGTVNGNWEFMTRML